MDRTGHTRSHGRGLPKSDLVAPLTMFRAIRMQMDELGLEPDYRVNGLSALVEILSLMS